MTPQPPAQDAELDEGTRLMREVVSALSADPRIQAATIESLAEQLEEAEAELAQWPKWGTVEVMVRNPQVAESIRHWEARAESAERKLAQAMRVVEAADEVVARYALVRAKLDQPSASLDNYIAERAALGMDKGQG